MHNQLVIDSLHDLVQPAIRFDAQYFSDPEAALTWITDSSERLLALRAEWADRPQPAAPVPTPPVAAGQQPPNAALC